MNHTLLIAKSDQFPLVKSVWCAQTASNPNPGLSFSVLYFITHFSEKSNPLRRCQSFPALLTNAFMTTHPCSLSEIKRESSSVTQLIAFPPQSCLCHEVTKKHSFHCFLTLCLHSTSEKQPQKPSNYLYSMFFFFVSSALNLSSMSGWIHGLHVTNHFTALNLILLLLLKLHSLRLQIIFSSSYYLFFF